MAVAAEDGHGAGTRMPEAASVLLSPLPLAVFEPADPTPPTLLLYPSGVKLLMERVNSCDATPNNLWLFLAVCLLKIATAASCNLRGEAIKGSQGLLKQSWLLRRGDGEGSRDLPVGHTSAQLPGLQLLSAQQKVCDGLRPICD